MPSFDSRVTPARADIAAEALRGRVTADRFSAGEARRIGRPVASLRFTPDAGARQESQLLFGEPFTVYETGDAWCWGQGELDGYVGYVPRAALAEPGVEASHRVAVRETLVFSAPDLKAPIVERIGHGSRVTPVDVQERFVAIDGLGWVCGRHLAPLDLRESDVARIGLKFLGMPYLWGGRSLEGLDCSGLVQHVLLALGLACPRDSDQQEQAVGEPVPDGPALTDLEDGDLIFFPGHVGFYLDSWRFLHANAHDMQVSVHNLSDVLDRARAADEWVTSVRRLRLHEDERLADTL